MRYNVAQQLVQLCEALGTEVTRWGGCVLLPFWGHGMQKSWHTLSM